VFVFNKLKNPCFIAYINPIMIISEYIFNLLAKLESLSKDYSMHVTP